MEKVKKERESNDEHSYLLQPCKVEGEVLLSLSSEGVTLQQEPIPSTSRQASRANSSSKTPTTKVTKASRKRKAQKESNVLDGYTWISGKGASAIYECDACPAKVMSDELYEHDLLHEEYGGGIRCKFCKVFVHFDQIFDHRKYECPNCPDSARLSRKDLRENNEKERELYSKKE